MFHLNAQITGYPVILFDANPISTPNSTPVASKRLGNPYPESLFRTYKYRPGYPVDVLTDVSAARVWAQDFE